MHRLKFLLFPLLLLLVSFPAQAQGGVLSVINSDDQFSILSRAIASADPSVAQALSGRVTIFAPNDTAFENLASFLDIDLDVLLTQEAIIGDLLRYHTLSGAFFSPQLISQYNGTVVPTLLENAFINVDVLEDGTIQLNDVAEVVSPDIAAGGGVIHVINDVLLNRVITRQLDDFLSGTGDTAEDAATEEATTDAESALAQVRVVNAASEYGPLSVTLGETVLAEALAFGSASEFVAVEPGIVPFSDGAGFEQDVNAEGVLTLVFAEEAGQPLLILVDQSQGMGEEQATITLVNLLQGADAVTFEFDGEADDFEFTDEENFATAAGSHTIVALVNNVVVGELSLVMPAGSRLLVLLIGTAAEPQLVRFEVPASIAPTVGSTTAIARQTLADLLDSDDRFTLLIEAIEQQEDEALLETLAGDVPYTIFAPTDAALEGLLVDVGVNSLDDLDSRVLRSIVLYHVIPGELRSDSLVDLNGQSVSTLLDGNLLTFGVGDDGSIQINNAATVIEADIVAANGVVHIIDTVLLPQSALDAFGF